MAPGQSPKTPNGSKPVQAIPSAVIRFVGDSGDGMQLAGTQFTDTAALVGNDVATFPDYPAEIRAPAGTVAGVSGFQINFAASDIRTPGDKVDALIAMNPASFKAHIDDVETGGIVIVNLSEFQKVNLKKAGYPEGYNPIEDEKYDQKYRLYRVPITEQNTQALANSGMSVKDIDRCKNMYALGLVYWLFDRSLDQTIHYLNQYFGTEKKKPEVAAANIAALKAGYFFGETAEMFPARYHVAKAPIAPGRYRKVTGNEATAMGMVAAAKLANKTLVYCSYPITPATDILHSLATMKNFGVRTFQAEDEIAAMAAAVGVAFGGQLSVTGTSGPGLCLKSEAINLAIMTELPVVIVNVQRGGPSTGLPTKTEQSDLLQAIWGRNGDSPLVVLAAQSPADCFDAAIEAVRLAFRYMVPVLLLTDGYLGNGSEPWRLPDVGSLKPINVTHPTDPASYRVYARNADLARPWAIPGTPGLEHRIGGLEKEHIGGGVCHVDANHQKMTQLRAMKVQNIAKDLPPATVTGDQSGQLLVVSWGGTYGTVATAVDRARQAGKNVSHLHLRYLNPMPSNVGDIVKRFKKVLVPELNTGQLRVLLRSRFLVDARGLNKTQGKPFLVGEVVEAIDLMLSGGWGDRESLSPWQHQVRVAAQDWDWRTPQAKPAPTQATKEASEAEA